jgi:hypothetical protein
MGMEIGSFASYVVDGRARIREDLIKRGNLGGVESLPYPRSRA